ncbi:MAG: MBL fold metallo-hydrolase [Flavobacteriales bacterium]
MKVSFLGTGTSQGVPVIGCDCKVCKSADAKDKRLRSAIHIQDGDLSIVVDTGPDFRQQMLRSNIRALDAVIFTHEHKDHTAGLDDIRAYNHIQQRHMDIYLTAHVEQALRKDYAYIFAEDKYPGIPLVNLHRIENKPFRIEHCQITPIEVFHYKLPVFGYRMNDFTYITDAKTISPNELEKVIGTKILVINALRKEKHISHFTLDEALEIIDWVKPETAYLTHLSHQMGLHEEIEASLPASVKIAYDGLILEF